MSEPNKKVSPWIVAAAGLVAVGAAYGASIVTSKKPAGEQPDVTVTVIERIPKGQKRAVAKAVNTSAQPPKVAAGSPEDLARRYQVPVSPSQPSQGPEDALVTLVMWCDFRSEACRAADEPLKQLMKEQAGHVRWVFRHLPESPATFNSHVFAQAAFRRAGKFWEVREQLLKAPADKLLGEADLRAIAERTGIKEDLSAASISPVGTYVSTDQTFAAQFGIARPMGIFVNGRRLPVLPSSELKAALDSLVKEELSAAQKLVKQHKLKAADAYAEITKDGYWGIGDDPEARKAAGVKPTRPNAHAALERMRGGR
jgi:protein-disulfide isomerase